MRDAHEKEKMTHTLARLTEALALPFHADKLSEDFGLDQHTTRLTLLWSGAQGISRAIVEPGFPSTYKLADPEDPTIALDLAHTILRCDAEMRLVA
jgi:hypothetical protein